MAEQLRVFFEGRVQGVGFRATTTDVARNFEVTGFVRNLNDGRVELLAEGEPQILIEFRDAVRSRLARNIANLSETWHSISQPEFESFQIAPTANC